VLKVIREGAIAKPWFFRLLMLCVAVVFAVSMGWWGFSGDSRQENHIAKVGEDSIPMEDYQLAYQRTSRFYRELFQSEYDDQKIRRQVIDGLVENKLWAQEAKRMGLAIGDAALKDAFVTTAAFQTEGKFDPELYKLVLGRLKMTPRSFEEKQREGLLIEKVKLIVKDGVALTPEEIQGIKEGDPSNTDIDAAIEDRLARKKDRAVMAYTLSLREKSKIVIQEDHL